MKLSVIEEQCYKALVDNAKGCVVTKNNGSQWMAVQLADAKKNLKFRDERSWSGYLSSLARKGIYNQNENNSAFGLVRLDIPEDIIHVWLVFSRANIFLEVFNSRKLAIASVEQEGHVYNYISNDSTDQLIIEAFHEEKLHYKIVRAVLNDKTRILLI